MQRGAGAQRLRGRTSPLAASSAPLEYTWPQMAARGASGTPPLTGWVRDGRLRSNPSPPPFLALRREGGWGHPPLQREFLRPLYFTALNRYAISSLSHMRTRVFGVFLKGRICAGCTKRRGDGYAPPPVGRTVPGEPYPAICDGVIWFLQRPSTSSPCRGGRPRPPSRRDGEKQRCGWLVAETSVYHPP